MLPPADGPVAQLDRASVFGTEGWGFEPLRGHHFEVASPFAGPKGFLKKTIWRSHSGYLLGVRFRDAISLEGE